VSVDPGQRHEEYMATDAIKLYAGDHAIEVEQFAVVFRTRLNSGDEGRFQELLGDIQGYFGAIDEPTVFQFHVGTAPPEHENPAKPVVKTLMDFDRDGKPIWSAQFGENAVSVSANKYKNWAKTWPEVKERLGILLRCVDPFKFIGSVEYAVTDTLMEPRKEQSVLIGKNIFKKGSWVPDRLVDHYNDPRWDFSGGAFVSKDGSNEILERIEAKGYLSDNQIVASIKNSFSYRFTRPLRIKDVSIDGQINGLIENIFSRLHDDNKDTIRSLLVNDLLKRMGLE
jgi:hypothetical protein